MIEMVNNARAEAGVAPLKANVELRQASIIRAEEISTVWGHTRPDGTNSYTALMPFDIEWWYYGENIARGHIYYDNYDYIQDIFRALMLSEGHRNNILKSNYTDIAIAIYYRFDPATEWTEVYVAQTFIKPQ